MEEEKKVETKTENKKKEVKAWGLSQITTSTALVITNPNGEALTEQEVLVEILNRLDKIEKKL